MLVIPCLFSSKQLLCVDVMGFSIKKKTLSGVLHGIEIRPVAAVAGTETNCLRPALQVVLVMR